MTTFVILLRLLALALASLLVPAHAQEVVSSSSSSSSSDEPTSTSTSIPSPTFTGVTRVVQVFFVDERSYEGLPYTLIHRDYGSVINVEANLTTYAITTTRIDQRPPPARTRTDNITTDIPTLAPSRRPGQITNTVGQPSTITQGPATFIFTGTRYGPDHTLINRCSLNGTLSAICNLTHVGTAWYTKNTAWNGTYSTYSYNWTSGDRFGFAPVTITDGAERLSETNPTASSSKSPNGAASRLGPARVGFGSMGWDVGTAVVVGVLVGMGILV